jgi:hypothetical protein
MEMGMDLGITSRKENRYHIFGTPDGTGLYD